MGNKTHNNASKERIITILTDILNSRFGITRKELVDKYNVNYSTIVRDLQIIEGVGFFLEVDNKNRYRFARTREYRQLKDLLHFSEEDQILLYDAIDKININTSRAQTLKKKLSSLYDLRQLGMSNLSHSYLQKIDELQKAINNKIIVILEDYKSSNSNKIANRSVEPFHINTSEDMIYAFDLDIGELRNFKISRINRINATVRSWQNESKHVIQYTDPFRITDQKLVMIHLRITIGGKNYLEEVYPLTKAYITETQNPHIYNFQCNVNHKFVGLDNFILGYYREIVEIVSPKSLEEHIQNESQKILKLTDLK